MVFDVKNYPDVQEWRTDKFAFAAYKTDRKDYPELDEAYSIAMEMDKKYGFEWVINKQSNGELNIEEDTLVFTPEKLMSFLADIQRIVNATSDFKHSLIFLVHDASDNTDIFVDFTIDGGNVTMA